jgi:tetratricopeptide (TPR) repeat protein
MLELITAPLLAMMLAVFGYVVVSDPQAMHVETLEAPDALAADGYTHKVVEARLFDAARRIETEARSFPSTRRLTADAEPTALRLMTDNIGATASVRAMQKALGWIDFSVSGEVVRKGDRLELLLRAVSSDGGLHAVTAGGSAQDVDGLLSDGAAALLAVADPYVRAAWQFKNDHAAGQGYAAARVMIKAAERDPRRTDPRWVANLGGVVAFTDHRLDDALGYFEQALTLDPDFSPALVNRGVVLASMGMHRDAIEHYRRVLGLPQGGEFGPAHAVAYSQWAVSLAALRQVDAARQSFEYAARTAPDYTDTYFKWAEVMRAAGREIEAARALSRQPDLGEKPPLLPEYLVGPIGLDAFSLVSKGLAARG